MKQKKIIRLNESALRRIITESVREAVARLGKNREIEFQNSEEDPYAIRVEFYSQEHSLDHQHRLVTPNESFENDIVPIPMGTTMEEVERMIYEVTRGISNDISDGIMDLYHRMSDSQACQVGAVVLKVVNEEGKELGKPVGINWSKVKARNTIVH